MLVLEPALRDGGVKTARKGVGEFTLTVDGVAAHAGADPRRGASAILELAHQVLAVQSLQQPEVGLTVNVGVIGGGTRSNVVAERASAEIDVRITRLEDGPRIEARCGAAARASPGRAWCCRGRINRPPIERTAGVVRLYELARGVGAELGWTSTRAARAARRTATSPRRSGCRRSTAWGRSATTRTPSTSTWSWRRSRCARRLLAGLIREIARHRAELADVPRAPGATSFR